MTEREYSEYMQTKLIAYARFVGYVDGLLAQDSSDWRFLLKTYRRLLITTLDAIEAESKGSEVQS